jgi:membrane associated rhomboid family serine protease
MGRPTLSTLSLFAAVFAAQTLSSLLGITPELFALALPLSERPWTIVTSVYAHGGLMHLFSNAFALLVVGPLIARVTTPVRFHTFFVATGSIAGISQVLLTIPFGPTAVLGASGAIFALLGYALVGNRASEHALAWLPIGRRGRILAFVALAALLTAATAAPGVALVAHFVGFVLGAAAGRGRILHKPKSDGTPRR